MLRTTRRAGLALALTLPWLAACAGRPAPRTTPQPPPLPGALEAPEARPLPPLSGLACLPDGSFLAVVDTKSNAPADTPRVIRVRLLGQEASWVPVPVSWPDPDGTSNDLEAVAPVPGTDSFLLVESSFWQGRYGRILEINLEGTVLRTGPLPADVTNIEGAAVVRTPGGLVFLFGERGDGTIRWAGLDLSGAEIRLTEKGSVRFQVADPQGEGHRELSTLEADGAGRLFTASTVDPGNQGPFQSVVWEIGQMGDQLSILGNPRRIADVPDAKVEALAFCRGADGREQLFLGSDDEDFGGSLRPVPDIR
ncbi:MAG TPA: hypothetical protein VL025_19415 [Thermoanaerobaculia bacterium]|nr:hypothetical protein [Thermoanaerobaculia bacterium]